MTEHILAGCRTEPMASYLKSLGMLRLVSEQVDPTARGRWQDGCFVLDTRLAREELIEFFAERYAPTPIVSPWNGGSGFYPSDAHVGMNAILGSEHERFDAYRRAITTIRAWPEMPRSYDSVGEIVHGLGAVMGAMRLGKARSKLEAIEAEIPRHLQRAQRAIVRPIRELSLDDLEEAKRDLSKDKDKKKVAAGEALSGLIKAIKKARTECQREARGDVKDLLLPLCRSRLPEECLSWLDAAYVVKSADARDFNPILGTGGNEGRLDFSNNFMQRLSELLIVAGPEVARALFVGSVFGDPITGLLNAKIGQYDPGRAGGYNQGAGVESKDFKINPWDFVLLMEGAQTLAGSASRRSVAGGRLLSTIPFTVTFSAVGFSSSSPGDDGRAETWLPIWTRPTSFAELRYLFGEGRSEIGRKPARDGIDFARAAGTLGVDRGIDGFIRYTILKRRGDNYVALPTGRIEVHHKPVLRLLDDLNPIRGSLDIFLRRFKNVPAAFATARRGIDEALYACCESPDAQRFTTLVRALGRMEQFVAQRDRSKKPALNRPLHGLSPTWVSACDDGSTELRIASALAAIAPTGKVGSFRANMAGTDPSHSQAWAKGHGQTRWHGNSLVERLAGVLVQRFMDADRLSAPHAPLDAYLRLHPLDVVPFIEGETDDEQIEELLWGFTLVDWWKDGREPLAARWRAPAGRGVLPRSYCLLRVLLSPEPVRGVSIPLESRVLPLLRAGRTAEACRIAVGRLRSSDLDPFEVAYEASSKSLRLLAALLLPVKTSGEIENLVLQEKMTATR